MSPEDQTALTWQALPNLFPGFPTPSRWLPLLQRHLQLVEDAAHHTRVTAVPLAEAVRRHYAESLELLRLALEHGTPDRIVDVGSGGGYPGLVMAVVSPASAVALIEPLKKRARLLEAMAGELGLHNVEVYPLRAEEAGRGRLRDASTIVTARAVAPLPELLEYAAPLAAPGAVIALPKGSGLDEELVTAARALEALNCELCTIERMRPAVSDVVRVAVLRKTGPTPEQYPRRPGLPARRSI